MDLHYNPESMNLLTLSRRLLVVAVLLFVAVNLSAQNTQYFVESTSADVDGEVVVNVRGINIDTLVGVQFSLTWDTEVLEFLRVDNVALNGSQAGNFNQTQLAEGRIGYLEADGTLVGFGLPDSSLLFQLVFNSLTTVTTDTEVGFTDAPLATSVRSSNNNVVMPDFVPGMITLNGSNSLTTFAEDPRLTVAPNPFRDQSQISLELDYAGTATVELLDLAGRRLSRRSVAFTPGTTTIELSARGLPANGTYLLRLTTGREQLHRKVILQGR